MVALVARMLLEVMVTPDSDDTVTLVAFKLAAVIEPVTLSVPVRFNVPSVAVKYAGDTSNVDLLAGSAI